MHKLVSSWTDVMRDLKRSWPPLTVIQGAGGCGKSTLLNAIWESNPEHTLCLAPTGIAAQNIRDNKTPAATIHSAFRLKPVDIYFYHENDYQRLHGLLDNIDILLIDEMSMINISLMDWILRLLEDSAIRGHLIKLVLLGDVLQLPPIFRVDESLKDIGKTLYGSNQYFFNSPLFRASNPAIYFMDKVYRQTDSAYAEALKSIREGEGNLAGLELFNRRVMSRDRFAELCGKPFITVVGTNREREAINRAEQERLSSEEHRWFYYETEYSGDYSGLDADRIPDKIVIHEGEQVMCTCNGNGYQNGILGRVIGFTEESNLPVIRTSSGQEVIVEYHTIKSLKPYVSAGRRIDYEVTGEISMLGCQSAYAVTTHKVQGLTIDKLYFQIGDWIPKSGVYVALSRCRNLGDIGISRPLRQSDITYATEAMEFLDRYRLQAA